MLIVDPVNRAVAAAHAGWRGTVEDVAGATVRSLAETFGSRPSDLVTWLGPSIGPCCYEVGEEVVFLWNLQAMESAREAIAIRQESKFFDLRAANRLLLRRAGVRQDNIEISDVCTKCDGNDWFSHRGQGANTGRFAAFIAISDDSE
jgi:YfiH family protein